MCYRAVVAAAAGSAAAAAAAEAGAEAMTVWVASNVHFVQPASRSVHQGQMLLLWQLS